MGIDMDGMTFSEFTGHRLQYPDRSCTGVRSSGGSAISERAFARHVCDTTSRKLEAILREQLQPLGFMLQGA